MVTAAAVLGQLLESQLLTAQPIQAVAVVAVATLEPIHLAALAAVEL